METTIVYNYRVHKKMQDCICKIVLQTFVQMQHTTLAGETIVV
jgi:hypothetical protein